VMQELVRYISVKQVADIVGLSRSTIRRLRSRGLFPGPIRVSPGRIAWSIADINSWIASRRAENLGWRDTDGRAAK